MGFDRSKARMPSRVALALGIAIVLGCDASDRAVVAVGDTATPTTEAAQITPIAPADFLAEPPANALILDVRSPREFASGHVPGAINVPHSELPTRLGELPTDRSKPLVVYCESGRRAAVAEAALLEAGFTGVHHLVGDMKAWRSAGRPVETPPG